jgi:hypothetical protein
MRDDPAGISSAVVAIRMTDLLALIDCSLRGNLVPTLLLYFKTFAGGEDSGYFA